jgi:hypothetical protein
MPVIPLNGSSSTDIGVDIFESAGIPDIARVLTNSVPAVVGTACWGDETSVLTITNKAELMDAYGTRANGTLVKFVEIMLNEGVGQIKCYRVIGAGGVKATASKAAGVATTWDFTAKYKGTVGNLITYQVLAGDITNTMTVEIVRLGTGKKYTCANVTNTSTDANYIGTMFDCDWVDFAKTGTATTLPTADASPVALTTGANGSAPADSDLVTGLVAFETDKTINRVAIAATASATIRSGILAHCYAMQDRIGFVSPVNETSAATVVAELASNVDPRLAYSTPPCNYYNAETALYEAVSVALPMAITRAYSVHIAPLMKPARYYDFYTEYTDTEVKQLRRAGAFVGGSMGLDLGSGMLSQNLEYSKVDTFWGKINVRSSFDLIEKYLDTQYRRIIGFQGDVNTLNSLISNITVSVMEMMKRLGVCQGYTYDVSENTMTTLSNALGYVKVYALVYPALEYLRVDLGKYQDFYSI